MFAAAVRYSHLALVFQRTANEFRGYNHIPCIPYDFTEADALTLVSPPQVASEHKVDVVNQDSFEAAKDLLQQYRNVAVLNMASDKNPGGGVWKGCHSQEEDLCRRSNLYWTIAQDHSYPFNPFTVLWSPEVEVRFDSKYEALAEPFKVSVISSAALRKPNLINDDYNQRDYDTMMAKMRCLLYVAKEQNVEALVLGAYGCGVFQNPPSSVALMFKKLLDTEFRNTFQYVRFAVLDTKNEGNYSCFTQILTTSSTSAISL